jgi:hypothetical protein
MKHSVERIRTSLQIEEDIDLHIRSWIIQRIGWGLMLIFLVLAALGLFGNGFLSEQHVSADGASLTYERFSRYENNTALEIETSARRKSISIHFDPGFAQTFKVEKINPAPSGQKIQDGVRIDSFAVEGRAHITYFLSPRIYGDAAYVLQVNESRFQLAQYIYP